jgi:hypothetical protein
MFDLILARAEEEREIGLSAFFRRMSYHQQFAQSHADDTVDGGPQVRLLCLGVKK